MCFILKIVLFSTIRCVVSLIRLPKLDDVSNHRYPKCSVLVCSRAWARLRWPWSL